MKAYKLVQVINGKYYSFTTNPSLLKQQILSGATVQYELNKKTTHKKHSSQNPFLFCFKTLEYANCFSPLISPNQFKIFECVITKSKSKSYYANIYSKSYRTVLASSVTLTKEITS